MKRRDIIRLMFALITSISMYYPIRSLNSDCAQDADSTPFPGASMTLLRAGLPSDAKIKKYLRDSRGGIIVAGTYFYEQSVFLIRVNPTGADIDVKFGNTELNPDRKLPWGWFYKQNMVTHSTHAPLMFDIANLCNDNGNFRIDLVVGARGIVARTESFTFDIKGFEPILTQLSDQKRSRPFKAVRCI